MKKHPVNHSVSSSVLLLAAGGSALWHTQAGLVALQALNVAASSGLSAEDAQQRLNHYGRNSLPQAKPRGAWLRLALQFHNPLIYVLLAAAALTFGLKDYVDTGVIVGVVLINALMGFIQEGKAEKALDAVSALLAHRATVLRAGAWHLIDAALLVPGDIVQLESGTRVPADLRLLRVKNLRVNEAALTGESVPVEKQTEPVAQSAAIGDRLCMAYAGTVVSFGQAHGVVVNTGVKTEMGHIGALVRSVPPLATPLTRRLKQFAEQITLLIVIAGLITFLYGYFIRQMPMLDIILAVVGLAVAAIPEGLPAVVTIVLAIGTRVLARNNALIRRLPAVETLGSVTVICSDKTGTLTKNEMTAVQVLLTDHTLGVEGTGYAPEGGFHEKGGAVDSTSNEALHTLARCALLCNDAQLHYLEATGWQLVGDPTEGALLTLAHKAIPKPEAVAAALPRLDEIPFESEHRFMATLHHDLAGHYFVWLKGAPERVLDLCIKEANGAPINRPAWAARIEAAARGGQRMLALAQRDMPPGTTALSMADMTAGFTLLGLVGLIDPPREEAILAVAECLRAGLRVKMITGDHVTTAVAIGQRLGLRTDHPLTGEAIQAMDEATLGDACLATDIFARASPEHKLRIVAALQAKGELVAMTGDGVNDAPALKAANIGVAMGQKGTDAARAAADLVLTDDNFATITRAVRAGRVVFDNIKKTLLFMLPTNGGQAGVILLAVFAGLTLPITAGQILWVNTVTAISLALALAFEPAEPGVMHRPPRRPMASLISPALALRVLYVIFLLIFVTFAVFQWELARGSSIEIARTAAVNMLVFGELVYLFNVRNFTAHAFTRTIFSGNRVALAMSLLLIGLQLLFTYAPPLQQLFHTAALDMTSWLVIFALGFAKFLAVEAEKTVLRRFKVQNF